MKKHLSMLDPDYRRLNEILETTDEAYYTVDSDWRVTYVNRKAADYWKQSRGELVGATLWEIYAGCDPETTFPAYIKAMRERLSISMETFCPKRLLWVKVSAYPVSDGGLAIRFCEIDEREREQEKKEALLKAIEMKDDFLTLVTHEFKTPLTLIISAVQAMKYICRQELSDKANGFLLKILQGSNRLLKLVDNLLDLSKINAGYFQVNRENTDIVALTKSVTESVRIYAEQKNIRLTFQSTLGEKVIGLDGEKFERVLLNLLSNAVKFTPKGKSIGVGISQKAVSGRSRVFIRVTDMGIGIPPDKQVHIFERLWQADSSLSRQAEGTGIGLSLVRKLVEIMGGEIALESSTGSGSTFLFSLPATRVKRSPVPEKTAALPEERLIRAATIEFSDVYI